MLDKNHGTIILEFCYGNGRKCNADDAWYKPEWYFTQVIMGWRPVVVQFGIQILILAFHLNSLRVEVYSLDKITFKKSIIAGTFAGLRYCWNIKLIQNWVLCSACNWMITLRAVVSPGRTRKGEKPLRVSVCTASLIEPPSSSMDKQINFKHVQPV